MNKDHALEAIQSIAKHYGFEFTNIMKLSNNELAFLHKILSKTFVQDKVIRLLAKPGEVDDALKKAEKALVKEGYAIVL